MTASSWRRRTGGGGARSTRSRSCRSTVGRLMPGEPDGRIAIRGRVVTMDRAGTVIPDGVVYVAGSSIAAVLPAATLPPAGFEAVRRLWSGGTVYPGLIELHNHLSYNCLQLWQVPQPFTNRGQWSTGPDYRRLIS